jgi:pyruvate formate lyase activating enzyme
MEFPEIYGLNKCSEAGVDIFALSIFLGNCNLRCPYCMNAKLINPIAHKLKPIDIKKVKEAVEENQSEWVIISGGEPTCTPVLLLTNLITEIKSWGCKVGLSTNGTNRGVFESVLPLLDYVALDIKTSNFQHYVEIGAGNINSIDILQEVLVCKTILVQKKLDNPDFSYEIRTTLYPPFVSEKDINEIGGLIRIGEEWVLQQFRVTSEGLDKSISPYTQQEMDNLFKLALKYTINASVRYI